jgi:hypothetical protein
MHTHSCLSVHSTHALLCLGAWSLVNHVKTKDVMAVAALRDVEGDEGALDDGWDAIVV